MGMPLLIRTIGLDYTYDIIILKQRVKDWFRRQKVRWFHTQGGPRKPSKETGLYFDWRGVYQPDKQTPGNAHPGTRVL